MIYFIQSSWLHAFQSGIVILTGYSSVAIPSYFVSLSIGSFGRWNWMLPVSFSAVSVWLLRVFFSAAPSVFLSFCIFIAILWSCRRKNNRQPRRRRRQQPRSTQHKKKTNVTNINEDSKKWTKKKTLHCANEIKMINRRFFNKICAQNWIQYTSASNLHSRSIHAWPRNDHADALLCILDSALAKYLMNASKNWTNETSNGLQRGRTISYLYWRQT